MEGKDLSTETFQTLEKEIKKHITKWKALPQSWIGRIDIVKMSVGLVWISTSVIDYPLANKMRSHSLLKEVTAGIQSMKVEAITEAEAI